MGSEGRTASIDEFSEESPKKENVRAQTQCMNTLDRIHPCNNVGFNNSTKLFVGGLPGDLTLEEFKAYFEEFGSIKDVVVMFDKLTSKPRGFGFVTYESQETTSNVLKKRYYELKNKRVEVKKAVSKERMSTDYGNYYNIYDGMYYGNTAYYGNFGAYYYGMNGYGYGGYNGLGYQELSCVNYPYQTPNYSYYTNTYMYQSPYNYESTSYSTSNRSHINTNISVPIVVKRKATVKDGGDSDLARKNVSIIQKEETESVGSRSNDSSDVLENGNGEISEGLSLCCNCSGDGDGDRDDGCGCREVIIKASSLYSDGSCEQMGASRQSASCTSDS